MKVISIDVGIKNLAYCLLETETQNSETLNILKWDSINLCGDSAPICTINECKRKAKYFYDLNYFCEIIKDNKIYYCNTHAKKIENKQEIISKTISANKIDLVSVGISVKKSLDVHFPILDEAVHIVIENQISPIATRMKTLQGMLMQYFIMRGCTSITFASSINKLKAFTLNIGKKTSYKDRKKMGIEVTDKILNLLPLLTSWTALFLHHQKKDDLADSFLQGVWFLQSSKNLDKINIK